MENKDRPAFPVTKDMGYTDTGLTKLEEISKSAMQGILASGKMYSDLHGFNYDRITKESILIAEKLLARISGK